MIPRSRFVVPLNTLAKAHKRGLRVGFELETQKTDGYTWDDCGTNEDAYQDALSNWVDDHMPSVDFCSSRQEHIVRDALLQEASNHVNEEDYGSDPGDNFCLPSGISVHEDGSVSGFEFVTFGPRTLADALKKSRHMLTKFEHEIDEGCSFHVHVSRNGTHWDLAERLELQRLATWYLANIPRSQWPNALNERWDSGEMSTWASFEVEDTRAGGNIRGKRAAVSCRPETLEFRLWGNIDTPTDAYWCLAVTAAAMNYALDVQAGLAEAPPADFRDSDLHSALVDDEPVSVAYAARKDREAAYAAAVLAEANEQAKQFQAECDAYTNEFLKAVGQS